MGRVKAAILQPIAQSGTKTEATITSKEVSSTGSDHVKLSILLTRVRFSCGVDAVQNLASKAT